MNPPELRYSKEHEWVRLEGENTAVIGITHYAQDMLGDVVYLDLPEPSAEVIQFEKLGELESVKAVSDIFSPISGTIIEANKEVLDTPELVNKEPFGRGWMARLRVKDVKELDNLMTVAQYDEYCAQQH